MRQVVRNPNFVTLAAIERENIKLSYLWPHVACLEHVQRKKQQIFILNTILFAAERKPFEQDLEHLRHRHSSSFQFFLPHPTHHPSNYHNAKHSSW